MVATMSVSGRSMTSTGHPAVAARPLVMVTLTSHAQRPCTVGAVTPGNCGPPVECAGHAAPIKYCCYAQQKFPLLI